MMLVIKIIQGKVWYSLIKIGKNTDFFPAQIFPNIWTSLKTLELHSRSIIFLSEVEIRNARWF